MTVWPERVTERTFTDHAHAGKACMTPRTAKRSKSVAAARFASAGRAVRRLAWADAGVRAMNAVRTSNGVPPFNFDRAQTIASIERMKQIVGNVKATVIIQHDMRDIAKLPAFPAAAK